MFVIISGNNIEPKLWVKENPQFSTWTEFIEEAARFKTIKEANNMIATLPQIFLYVIQEI